MNGKVVVLEKILDRFKLRHLIPDTIRAHSMRTTLRALIAVLEKNRQYSAGYGLVLRVFFLMRKAGLPVSMRRARIILATGIIAISTALMAIGFFVATSIHLAARVPVSNTIADDVLPLMREQQSPADKHIIHQSPKKEIPATADTNRTAIRLAILDLSAPAGDEALAANLTAQLFTSIRRHRGADRVVYRNARGASKPANRQLHGRITRLGGRMIIALTVVDVTTGATLYAGKASLAEGDDVQEKIRPLIQGITIDKNIWEQR